MTKPNPVGRPRRARTAAAERVTIRLTKPERTKYEASATKQGLTFGEWAREAFELAYARGSSR